MKDPEIGLFEAIYSQRAIRSFRPDAVSDALVSKVVEAATKAPSPGNSQPWAFIVVQDRALIAAIGAYAHKAFDQMYERASARSKPGDPPPFPRLKPMVDNFEQIPVLIFPCLIRREGSGNSGGGGSSIFPAVQNLLLAARGVGLGAVLTSLGLSYQDEIKELLGAPENVELMALIPLGYPDKEHYGPTSRKSVNEITHWDRWGSQHS